MRIFFSMRVYGEGEYKRVNKSGYIRGCSTSKRDPLRASGILVCTHKLVRTRRHIYTQVSLCALVNTFDLLENAIGQLERAIRFLLSNDT